MYHLGLAVFSTTLLSQYNGRTLAFILLDCGTSKVKKFTSPPKRFTSPAIYINNPNLSCYNLI